ncbi:MAG: hypothetical protein GY856_07350 [bacterium]|nr:hypothetical protein [bacterium]
MMDKQKLEPYYRAFRLCLWLYLFMVSIKMMGTGFKTLGSQVDIEGLLTQWSDNPLMGVCIGLIATALVQSSSFTTSMLVSLVASGFLSLGQAIPMVMGANLGTTITSFFVASAHVARREEFRRAFSACTVHDIFNLLAVLVLLPVEWLFHPLQWLAEGLGKPLGGLLVGGGGGMPKSPLDALLKPVVHGVEGLLQLFSDNPKVVGSCLILFALVVLFISLSRMVIALRAVFMGGVERVVHEFLFKRWWTALLFGIVVTALVQSSSMTVSLIVPMVASGILTIERAFPFTLGANIGTTITAFLAAMVAGSPAGIALALAHLFFNAAGTAVFLPLRKIPITLTLWLAKFVYSRRWFAFVFIGTVFFLIPAVILALCRAAGR